MTQTGVTISIYYSLVSCFMLMDSLNHQPDGRRAPKSLSLALCPIFWYFEPVSFPP